MSREKEGFRDALDRLSERYPGKECITIKDCCEIIGCNRETLTNDKTFPLKKISGKYVIPLVGLARWMV